MAKWKSKRPKVSFEWEGIEELRRCLTHVGESLDDRDERVKAVILERAALPMVANARNLAPVKTGALRGAIYATKGGAKQRGVLIGVRRRKAVYAPWVEFGTSQRGAHPYFRPAFMQMAATYAADIAPGIKAIAEQAAAEKAYHPK